MRQAIVAATAVVVVVFAVLWFDPFRLSWRKPMTDVAAADAEAVRQADAIKVSAQDWPWWRGPGRNGIATGDTPPERWSKSENVLWQADVPGRGHASPIVVGDKIFIATADEEAQTMALLAYERATGKQLWQRELHKGGFVGMHPKNSHASATPACDGERVFTVFAVQGHVWVTAVGLDGKILWQEKAGPFVSRHGYGSSPVLYRSLVIVAGDNVGPSYIVALERQTGKLVWRKARTGADSYGSPIIGQVAGREQLLVSGQNTTISYDPASGDISWQASGPADVTGNTVAFDANNVYTSGGYPQNGIFALNGKDGKQLWQRREKVYVTSMLAQDGRLFAVQDSGSAAAYDAASSKELWSQRLGQTFSASPVQCGKLIFVPSEGGKTFVIQTEPEYKVLAGNTLEGEGYMASPAICGGRIYLRSEHHLYCIGKK